MSDRGSEPSPIGFPSYLLREEMRTGEWAGVRGSGGGGSVGRITGHLPEIECGRDLFSCLFL